METQEPKDIIRDLKASPLFNLSLSSKELFHSNFLAWLCQTYSKEVGRIFIPFLRQELSHDERSEVLKVLREDNHTDLQIEYSNGQRLIIENKVKSLPQSQQLKNYAEKFPNKSQTNFLLLSLMQPKFEPEELGWQYLSYNELAKHLESLVFIIRDRNLYHGQMLNDYVNFVRKIDEIQNYIIAKLGDDEYNFFAIRNMKGDFKAIRLHDLYEKILYSELLRRVGLSLRSRLSPEDIQRSFDRNDFKTLNQGELLLGIGRTKFGDCLFDLKYCLSKYSDVPVIFGVQFQMNQFRLFIETTNPDISRKIFSILYDSNEAEQLWFNFPSILEGLKELPKSKKI